MIVPEIENPGRDIDTYEALVEARKQIGEGAAVYDAHAGHYIYVDDAFCRITGYSREECLKLQPARLVPDDEKARFNTRMVMRMTGGQSADYYQTVIKRKDGREIIAEVSVKAVDGTDGTKYVAVVHDITRHSKLEAALMRCRETLSEHIGHLRSVLSNVRKIPRHEPSNSLE